MDHHGVDRENSVHLVLAVGLMGFIDSRSREEPLGHKIEDKINCYKFKI